MFWGLCSDVDNSGGEFGGQNCQQQKISVIIIMMIIIIVITGGLQCFVMCHLLAGSRAGRLIKFIESTFFSQDVLKENKYKLENVFFFGMLLCAAPGDCNPPPTFELILLVCSVC